MNWIIFSRFFMLVFMSFITAGYFYLATFTMVDERKDSGARETMRTVLGTVCALIAGTFGIIAENLEMGRPLHHEVPYIFWISTVIFLTAFYIYETRSDRYFVYYITPSFVRKLFKLQTTSLACC